MDRSFYQNALRAARAGMVDYCDRGQWAAAMDYHADTRKGEDEAREAAYLRLLDQRDPDMAAMNAARLASPDPVVAGRPRTYTPGEITRSDAERALTDRALAEARRTGQSFEKAFAELLDTPEGRELWKAART